MELNMRKVITSLKRYIFLGVVMIISIGIGYCMFSVNITENISYANIEGIQSEASANEMIDNSETVLGLTINDIINKNKVIVEKIEIEKQDIPFETIELGASRTGTATVLTKGVNGQKKVTYKIRYEDDIEVSKTEVASSVVKKAINKVVQYQTASITSRSGDTVNRVALAEETSIAPVSGYSKVIDMQFTSYCLCKKCTGKSPGDKGYGITASGYKITPGKNEKVVAVDPKVIPLGSKVYVQGVNGVKDYGYATAEDTGGAIKGNKIDLYVDVHGQQPWWTVGKVKVYVF